MSASAAPALQMGDLLSLSRALDKEQITFRIYMVLLATPADPAAGVTIREIADRAGCTVNIVQGYTYKLPYWNKREGKRTDSNKEPYLRLSLSSEGIALLDAITRHMAA